MISSIIIEHPNFPVHHMPSKITGGPADVCTDIKDVFLTDSVEEAIIKIKLARHIYTSYLMIPQQGYVDYANADVFMNELMAQGIEKKITKKVFLFQAIHRNILWEKYDQGLLSKFFSQNKLFTLDVGKLFWQEEDVEKIALLQTSNKQEPIKSIPVKRKKNK